MKHVINVKELRSFLPEIMKRVQRGEQYTVLYRSRPAFRIVALQSDEVPLCPLSEDPLFEALPVGASADGMSAADHDACLYGKGSQ